jgi:hypothetical protein
MAESGGFWNTCVLSVPGDIAWRGRSQAGLAIRNAAGTASDFGTDKLVRQWQPPETFEGSSAAEPYRQRLILRQPGYYVLTATDGPNASPVISDFVHVIPFRNLLRAAGGVTLEPFGAVGEISYHRLLAHALDIDFALGVQTTFTGFDGRLAAAASGLGRSIFRIGSVLFGITGSVFGGPSFEVRERGPTYAYLGASAGMDLVGFATGEEVYAETSDSEVLWAVGPKLELAKLFDGSKRLSLAPLLQIGFDF